MPLIGFFCRAFEGITFLRRKDALSDPAIKRETFDKAVAVVGQARHAEGDALQVWAQRIVSGHDEVPASPPSPVDEFALRRRLLAGYAAVRAPWAVFFFKQKTAYEI